jgi:UPF0755 protein
MSIKKTFLTKYIILLPIIIIVGLAGSWLHFLYSPVVSDKQGIKFVVTPGSTIHDVIENLQTQQIVTNPYYFKILVKIKKNSHQLKAGQYLFKNGTTAPQILQQITTGTGLYFYTFTIVPGWTFNDIRNALLKEEKLHHTVQSLSDKQIMQLLGAPNLKPEGWFFPNTYYYSENDDDLNILKRSYKEMQTKLNLAWQGRSPNLPFKTPYEALIGASIIEKEAYFQNELPRMAGVMINRLKKNMRLQFDPTVIYGLGSHYDGKIHKKDLTQDTPYNTYTRKGLPPTPIAMPSLAAIKAVMNPEQNQYYFFVAQNNRESIFSKELAEHNKAVQITLKSQGFFNIVLTKHYLLKQISYKGQQ